VVEEYNPRIRISFNRMKRKTIVFSLNIPHGGAFFDQL
jgi:hypothetical protein